jgi:chromosomal replication initiation ATPase DnaA
VWQARAAALRLTLPQAAFDPVRQLGEATAAVVEDVDRWIGQEAAERQLLHLYNVLAERRGHLMLTAQQPPARWAMTLADLRSRIAAAPAAAIEPPDEALVTALLMKLFADRQIRVGDDVLTFLLARMERSFDAARRLVAALDTDALQARRNVTVPLAGDVLRRVGPDGRAAEDDPHGHDHHGHDHRHE